MLPEMEWTFVQDQPGHKVIFSLALHPLLENNEDKCFFCDDCDWTGVTV